MTIAAVSCVACAHAATVSWNCTKVYKDADNKADGIAYFLNTTDYGTISEFKAAVSGKGASAMIAALGDAYSWTPAEAGTYSMSGIENSALGLADGTAYSAYIVVFNTTTITENSKFYITSAQDLTTQTGNFSADVTFSGNATPSKSADNWATVSTPEPTTGMLVFLGIGLMALKRKVA